MVVVIGCLWFIGNNSVKDKSANMPTRASTPINLKDE